jgi:ABC-2 type transport system permease protein
MSDMPSKKSFFRSGIIKQDLRQHGWIGIVYFICLLFTIPLEILQLASRNYVNYEDYQNYMMINPEVQIIFLFLIPIAAGLLLFRYLQNEAAVDMIHSLPIRRETLYINHIISGLVLLIIPILLTSCVTFFVTNSIEEFQSILTLSELFSWTGLIILMTCMMFFFTVSVGMMTGMSSAQGILTYIFLFLPIAMVTMVSYNLSFLLFGYSTIFLDSKMEYLSPFFRFIGTIGQPEPFSTLEVAIYTILTVFFLIIGLVLYKARQLERATDVIAFPFLRPVFKYGVTFCSMIVGGSYFSATGDLNWNWIMFGYVWGAVFGYTVAEMILQKTWRIFQFRVFTGLIIYSAIFIILLVGIKNDFMNYENKLPRMDQISEVYFGNKYSMQELFRNDAEVYSDSKLYIQDVRKLHEYITGQKDFIESQDEEDIHVEYMVISYRLNNGKAITREYRLPLELMKKQLKPIMEAEDYKRTLPQFLQLHDKAFSINIVANGPMSKNVVITDPFEMEEFSQALKKDFLSQSLEDLLASTSPWGHFEFTRKHPDEQNNYEAYHFEWKKSYDEVTSWLDEHDYLEDARITMKDIVKAEVTKGPKKINKDMYESDEFFKQGEQFFTLTDPKVLEEALQNFIDYPDGHTYHIKFILKDGSEWYGSLPDEQVPNDIRKLFE